MLVHTSLKLFYTTNTPTPFELVCSAAVLPQAFTILMCYFLLLRFSLMLMKQIGVDISVLQGKPHLH